VVTDCGTAYRYIDNRYIIPVIFSGSPLPLRRGEKVQGSIEMLLVDQGMTWWNQSVDVNLRAHCT
jgi:hypothetical protein